MAPSPTPSPRQPPTQLIRHARIVPLTTTAPTEPVDVLLRGDRVVEVGVDLAAPDAEMVDTLDAEGRWLMPGLWDQHVHLGQWTLASQRLDLAEATSVTDALDRVAVRAAELPEVPIVGWGHRSTTWLRQPTVEDLDRACGSRPVVLISGDGHHAWLNSAALRALDLPARETDQQMVSEGEWFSTYARLVELVGSEGTSAAAYTHTMRQAAARGVVGLVDLEFDQQPEEWPTRVAEGAELLRVRVGAYPATVAAYVAQGLRTGDRLPGCELVTMGPLKVISDGSLNTHTAWCREPYAGTGAHGAANFSTEELDALLRLATAQGLEVAVHALGDAAVGAALDSIARSGARGSIEHAQVVTREDCARMAALGVRASVQPSQLFDDRTATEIAWPDRTGRCFALRWLRDAGVGLAMGSDAPVAALDPWLTVAAAVHRTLDDRPPWHPEQSLSAKEALQASTDGHGTVAPGSLADLILLDADPLAPGTSAEQGARLRGMSVSATWVAGRRLL